MKKVLCLLFAVAVVLCSCSDTMKAKKLAKNYLKKNSNDGKIEVVEWGELEDYEYVDNWEKERMMMDAGATLNMAEHFLDMWDIYKGSDGAGAYIDSAEMYRLKADSIKAEADKIVPEKYPMHRMKVKFRGNNALGNKVVNDGVLFFNEKVTYCSADAGEARSK